MIVTSEAVVLRAMKYHESSLIARLYTRAYGKISVIAKGARSGKGRFGSALQPMSHVCAVFYKKEGRDLYLLSQCDILEVFSGLSDDLARMAPALTAVELVDLVAHSEEENQPLFDLLVGMLQTINNATKNGFLALYYFEVKLLELLGFMPELRSCSACGKSLDEKAVGRTRKTLRRSPGGLVCPECSSRGLGLEPVSPVAASVLQRLQALSDVDAATRISLRQDVRDEVSAILRKYLETHVEDLRKSKAESVFSAMGSH